MTATDEETKGVDAGSVLVSKAAQTIADLANVVEASAQHAQQIVAGVQQQTIGLDQIAEPIAAINDGVSRNAAEAAQSQRAALGLNQLAQRLEEIVGDYHSKR